jgi:DNA-binding MarR family transcriptional regulator
VAPHDELVEHRVEHLFMVRPRAELRVVTLAETPDNEIRPRDLGRQLAWDRSRVSHQLRRMEQRGLVTRQDWEGDARGTLVRFTNEGRQVFRNAAPGHVAWIRRHFLDLLSEREAATLTRVSRRVVERLQSPED